MAELPVSPAGGRSMNQPDTATVLRTYYSAWTSKDFATATSLLDDSVRVENPLTGYEDAKTFASSLAGLGSLVTAANLLSAISEGDEAMLLYDLEIKRLGPLRVAEHFTVANGKIILIRQIFDTAEVRAAGLSHPV